MLLSGLEKHTLDAGGCRMIALRRTMLLCFMFVYVFAYLYLGDGEGGRRAKVLEAVNVSHDRRERRATMLPGVQNNVAVRRGLLPVAKRTLSARKKMTRRGGHTVNCLSQRYGYHCKKYPCVSFPGEHAMDQSV